MELDSLWFSNPAIVNVTIHAPALDIGQMLVYNLLNLCVCTGSGKENTLTNVKPSLNPRLLQGFSGNSGNGEERQRSGS